MVNKRRRRRKKNNLVKWFKKLSMCKKAALIAFSVLLVVLFVVVLFVASKFSKLNTEKIEESEIYIPEFEQQGNAEVGEAGYTNFVLFGGDSRSGDVNRDLNTDAIIIVSLNNKTKEVKMVSVYRDTLLDLSNGTIQKCNAAYSRGGAKQAISMLNMNLDLSIQKYVTVDFGAVIDVIDMLGGIEVDVSPAEMRATNNYIAETATVTGNKVTYLQRSGVQTLNGVQATTYARIRKGVGDDYARTARQRLIIKLAAEKAMKSDFATLNKIIDKVFPQVSTNLSTTEILKYAKDITKYSIGESTGFPFDKGAGTIPGKGSSVFPITLYSNVQKLHEFLYGTVDYQPTKKVQSISGEIAYIVGNREIESNTSWEDSGVEDPGNEGGDNTGTGDSGNAGTGDSGDTGTGDSGDTGTGDSSNAGTGDSGNAGSGDTGNAGSEDSGNAGTGDSGNAGTGDSGNAGTGDSGNAGTGDSGNAGAGDSGNAGTGDSGNAGTGDSGNAEAGDSGNTGTGDSGSAGAGDVGAGTIEQGSGDL